MNDSNIPHIHSATQKSGKSRCNRLYNLQGKQNNTMVYSKLLEDAAVRPNEYKVWCEQCSDHHPVHNQPDMLIIFVTKDRELAKGTKSHMGGPRDKTFLDHLQKMAFLQIRPFTSSSWTSEMGVLLLTM